MTPLVKNGCLCVFQSLVLLVLVCQAHGDSISYTIDLNSKTQPGFVPLFDAKLGTLTQVLFTAAGSAEGLLSVAPDMITSGTYDQIVSFLYGPFPGGTPISLGSQTVSVDFTYTIPTTLIQTGVDFSVTSMLSTGLDAFQGSGVANIQTIPDFTLTDPAEPGLQPEFAYAFGTGTFTYLYTVPEPPAFVLGLIPAFAGLGCWAVRRGTARA